MSSRFYSRTRALILTLNLATLLQINKLRRRKGDLVIVVAYDNSFQVPTVSGMAQRNLESLFTFFESKQINFVIVRPLFALREYRKKNRKIMSIESIMLFELSRILTSVIFRKLSLSEELKKIQSRTWERFFLLLKPQIVIGQSVPEVAYAACRSLGIKSAEIQHGIWFENETPLLTFDISNKSKSPNYIFTWSNYYSNLLNKSTSICESFGYPSTISKIKSSAAKDVELQKVLVCFTTGLINSIDPFGMIHCELDIMIKDFLARGIKVYLRPHPLTSQKTFKREKAYRWIKNNFPNCKVVSPFKTSLDNQVEKIDAIVSFDGTTIIDGYLRGIPTFYLSKDLYVGIPQSVLNSRIVNKVSSVEEILVEYRSMIISDSELQLLTQEWRFNPNLLIELMINRDLE